MTDEELAASAARALLAEVRRLRALLPGDGPDADPPGWFGIQCYDRDIRVQLPREARGDRS